MPITKPNYLNIQCDTHVPHGTCGNCGDTAYHPLEQICSVCADDLCVPHNTFTYYTYPSELMYNNMDTVLKRSYFISGRL